jgi:hypothetical protein
MRACEPPRQTTDIVGLGSGILIALTDGRDKIGLALVGVKISLQEIICFFENFQVTMLLLWGNPLFLRA